MFLGSIIKKLVPGGLKKKLFDMAVDGGLKRLGAWIKSLFTSGTKTTDPPVTKNKSGPIHHKPPEDRFIDRGPGGRLGRDSKKPNDKRSK